MDYKKTAAAIVEGVGGVENVKGLTHCVTRLRFSLADEGKANADALKATDGVVGVVQQGGQYQVIIGNEVDDVYDAITPLIGGGQGSVDANEADAAQKPQGIKGWANAALDTLISCFTPLIPAIAGAGMVKVLAYVLSAAGLIATESVEYSVLNVIGDGVYYFLPLLVAVTAANKMKTNPFLAMGIAGIMMHPNLLALGEAGSTVSVFGAPLTLVNYSAQALPIILSVWVMKYVEKFFGSHCPTLLKAFLPSMLTFLVVGPIALIAIGPLGTILGNGFQVFADLMTQWGWLAVALNAALFPFLVLTGMHNALIPLMIQMFMTQGFDPVFLPGGLCANLAEGAAAAAVAVRTKSKTMKSTAWSAAVSAVLGVTEPALYGVNLRLKRPFIAMVIGSFVGGAIAGLVGLTAYTFVSPSLLSLPIFAGAQSNFLLSMIAVPATLVSTFLITFFMGFEDVQDDESAAEAK
ncbi:MAG: PTS transporter subunit EIIC [Atopobiaceae bacterium]|nr:PTS transporter subunit EIIC [Atopobiaceae bacterium]